MKPNKIEKIERKKNHTMIQVDIFHAINMKHPLVFFTFLLLLYFYNIISEKKIMGI